MLLLIVFVKEEKERVESKNRNIAKQINQETKILQYNSKNKLLTSIGGSLQETTRRKNNNNNNNNNSAQ